MAMELCFKGGLEADFSMSC